METLKKSKFLIKGRESFILKKDHHESLAQGFLFSINLFLITKYFGIPDKYDNYIYLWAFVILFVSIIQIGIINYGKIKNFKKNNQ